MKRVSPMVGVLLLAVTGLLRGIQGCSPGRMLETIRDRFASVAHSLPLASPVQLTPEQQKRLDSLSPDLQESFHRMMRTFREVKAERSQVIERSNRLQIKSYYSEYTEDEFRDMLLRDPNGTLRGH